MSEARTPIGQAMAELATQDPDRPAVTAGSVSVTRAELEARTNRLARDYLARGVEPGSLVTIGLPSGLPFLEAVLAVWKAGATPQPVSHRLPDRELAAIIDLAQPSLVVGVEAAGRTQVPADHRPDPTHGDEALPPRIAPSLKAPTSGGSTGRPKLIVSTEEATAEALRNFAALVRITPDGVALSTGPLSHNGPLFTAAAALLTGSHVVVMERFDAAEALALVARHRVDWMYSVPTMLQRIAALPAEVRDRHAIGSLRTVITMAAHSSQSLREFCLDYFGEEPMLELYAATEAHAVAIIDGAGWRERPGSVGRVAVGEIAVRDPGGADLPAEQVGELWMRRGPGTAGPYRYVGSEAQRAEGGWETVGDMGWFDEAGYLYLADRRSDMIVVGGSNVYPAEVEAALEDHEAVRLACVVGLPDDEYGQVVHAVLNLDRPVTEAELGEHLRERVAGYKVPRSFESVDRPLRDEAGKLRRRQVLAEALDRPAQPTAGDRGLLEPNEGSGQRD